MISRRRFIQSSSLALSAMLISHKLGFTAEKSTETYLAERMSELHIPGMAVSLVKDNRIQWIRGLGWADIENRVPMDPERSVQNIGSISKTITATAIMQLWERQELGLDDDVNDYLDFPVRNPMYPDIPITFRQLLSHRSSIKDGDAYGDSYKCGDPVMPLGSWIREYFSPEGSFYDAGGNFHVWKPGEEGPLPATPRAYTNVGFGLLGYLVEVISGLPFEAYTRIHIFEPLGMDHTGWYLKDIDIEHHVTPYTYISGDMEWPPGFTYEMALPKFTEDRTPMTPDTYFPHCLYSFYNYPDGLLRTTAADLSRFMISYMNGGEWNGIPLLKDSTVRMMFRPSYPSDITRGLCWDISGINNGRFYGHGGGDPGINTSMYFNPDTREGIILLTNCSHADLYGLMGYLLSDAGA